MLAEFQAKTSISTVQGLLNKPFETLRNRVLINILLMMRQGYEAQNWTEYWIGVVSIILVDRRCGDRVYCIGVVSIILVDRRCGDREYCIGVVSIILVERRYGDRVLYWCCVHYLGWQEVWRQRVLNWCCVHYLGWQEVWNIFYKVMGTLKLAFRNQLKCSHGFSNVYHLGWDDQCGWGQTTGWD